MSEQSVSNQLPVDDTPNKAQNEPEGGEDDPSLTQETETSDEDESTAPEDENAENVYAGRESGDSSSTHTQPSNEQDENIGASGATTETATPDTSPSRARVSFENYLAFEQEQSARAASVFGAFYY